MAYKKMNVTQKVLKNGVHYLTSDYKSRNKSRPTHNGIDMIGKDYACDYIVAVADGVVSAIGNDSSRGNYVNIKHNNGLISLYYHMSNGSIVVKKGQNIKKGDKIGYMGNTGYSFGAHLHFGVSQNGKCIDPLPYLEGTKTFDESTSTPTVKPTGAKFNIGDEVIINGGLYVNSNADKPVGSVKNKKTVITRYAKGSKHPYNTTGDLGWMNESDITLINDSKEESTPSTYYVKKGDTLTKIANKFNTTVNGLIELNKEKYPLIKSSNGNHIEIGWELMLK